MEVRDCCLGCLRGLAEKTVRLSGGGEDLLRECRGLIEASWNKDATPPAIANRVLKVIRKRTGVDDPYLAMKEEEYRLALDAFSRVASSFTRDLEGVLRCSALGNSMDFFQKTDYSLEGFVFQAPMEGIGKEVSGCSGRVLILGDNPGDFVFDRPLIAFLQGAGREVYYAVKERPVQNDLSVADAGRFGLHALFPRIISSGTDEVGLREEDTRGPIREFWEGDGLIIAKGMGNYETITEFNRERPVIHVMKVKCSAVADDVGYGQGTCIAIMSGETHGDEKRLL